MQRRNNITSAKAIKNDWTGHKLPEFPDACKVVTIPVSIKIQGRQKILGLEEAEKILRRAKLISIEPCYCRSTLRNCDNPIDVCLSIDKEAEMAIAKRGGKETTIGKALAALRKSHKAGLVHMAIELNNHDIRLICSCCSCCCYILSKLTRFACDGLVSPSDMIAVHDPSTCDDCEICISRCHFNAWGLVARHVHHYPLKCFGCGVCATTCPRGSIRLVKRKVVDTPLCKGRPQGRKGDVDFLPVSMASSSNHQ